MGDLFADLKKKKKKKELAAAAPPAQGGGGLFKTAPDTRAPTGPQRGVEGYVPSPARAAPLPPEVMTRFEGQLDGPKDRTMRNLLFAHHEVFGTWPDYSLTADLIGSGEVEFNSPEEAVAFFSQVAKSYTGRNDWMLDPSQDTFGEGSMKRASGVSGFTEETDLLDPEMLASFRPKSVQDFLLGPYMKHTVEGESQMFRENRMRLDELTVALPKQWAISQLGDALTQRGRRRNPDLAEDEALMVQLNEYVAARLPKRYVDADGQTHEAPQKNARWQIETEAGLRQLMFMRASALYMATSIAGTPDEAAAGYLAAGGFRNMMTTLEQQIRLPADPTGKTDEKRRQWMTEWYVSSRPSHQTPEQAVHELYDISKDAVTLEGQRAVGADHMATYTGFLSAIKKGIAWVAEDALELDTLYESDEAKAAMKTIAPLTGAMGRVLGVAAAPMAVPMKVLEEYGAYFYGALSATQTAKGVIPNVVQLLGAPAFGNPIAVMGEFVAALHGDSGGDVEWFGDWLEDYSDARTKYRETGMSGLGDNAMRSYGLSPEAHPEVAFLWSFGLETAADMLLFKGASAINRLAAPTRTYRRLASLGKTTFVNQTVGGMAAKWINEDPNRAVARMSRIFGLETEQSRQLVAKAVGQDPHDFHFHHRPVSVTQVRDILDENVRVKGARLDPYAWGIRKAVRDEIEFSVDKWYSPNRHPGLQWLVARSNVRDAVPITGNRQEQASDWIDHVHRHVLNLADNYKLEGQKGASEVEVLKAKIEAQLKAGYHGIENKHRGSYAYTGTLIKELDEVQSMTDLSLWRQSLYARADQLSVARLRAVDPKAAAALSPEAATRLALAYRGGILSGVDNDVRDMLFSHGAEEGWVRRVGGKHPEEMQKFLDPEKPGHVPLAYQQSHWNVAQIRKALRGKAKEEPEGRFVPEQAGPLDKATGKPAEMSQAFNPQSARELAAAQAGQADEFDEMLSELRLLGMVSPERVAYHNRRLAEEIIPGVEADVDVMTYRAEAATSAKTSDAIFAQAAAEHAAAARSRAEAIRARAAEAGVSEEALGRQVDEAHEEAILAAEMAKAAQDVADQALLDADGYITNLAAQQPRWVVRHTREELELKGDLPALQETIDGYDHLLNGIAKELEAVPRVVELVGLRADDVDVATWLQDLRAKIAQTRLSADDADLMQLEYRLSNGALGELIDQRIRQADVIHARRAEIEGQLRVERLTAYDYTEQAKELELRLKERFAALHRGSYDARLGEGDYEHLLPEPELLETLERRVREGEITPAQARQRLNTAWKNRLARNDPTAAQMKEELNLLAERVMNGEISMISAPPAAAFDEALGIEGSVLELVNKSVREIVEAQGARRAGLVTAEVPVDEILAREAGEEVAEEPLGEVAEEAVGEVADEDLIPLTEDEADEMAEWQEGYPDLPWVPWTERMRAAEATWDNLDLDWQEAIRGYGVEDFMRWAEDPSTMPDEIVAFVERFDNLSTELADARLEWERANPGMLNVAWEQNAQHASDLWDEMQATEDPLQRLELQREYDRTKELLDGEMALRGDIDSIFDEIDLGDGLTAADVDLLSTLETDATARYNVLRIEADRAAQNAAESVRYAQAVSHRLAVRMQRLENYRAKLGRGTVYDGDEIRARITEATKAMDPSTPLPKRIEEVERQVKLLRESVERLTFAGPENWFDYSWVDAEGKTFLMALEPQPGVDWQLKQFHYPAYNYNKLSKFMYGGPVRTAEYLNSKKWFGYFSGDDFTSLYKALIMAKISTLIRIPMADEATRFISEGVNPLEAWHNAHFMRDFDKMPDDVKADIASLMERMSYGDSEFIRWGDDKFGQYLLKQAMDDRRSPVFAYWMSGRMKGVEGIKQTVRDWLADPKNEKSSLYKYVLQAKDSNEIGALSIVTRNGTEEVEDGLLLAYSLIGMTPGKGMHNLAFETHRLDREGKATSQVLDLARMLEAHFDYWTKHPAFGHFYRIADEGALDEDMIALMERGKWHPSVKLGAEGTVEVGGKQVRLSGHLGRREMKAAKNACEEIIKGHAGDPKDVDYLMPWVVGREMGIEVGGVPVVKNIQKFTYALLDRLGSTMNEMMYATSFGDELTELKKIGGLPDERMEELAHFRARQYVYDTMFNGSVYFGEDMLRNVFMFLPAYRQFVEYWVPQMVKKPPIASLVYRANEHRTAEGKEGFGWVRPIFYPNLQVNLSSVSFLINQGNNGVTSWLPGGGPLLTMPASLLASLNADDKTSFWGELPQHWPFTYATPFRALNSPLDKMVFGLTGRRLPWPLGSDPDRDPWRELMATRQDALDGKWPDEPKDYNALMRLRAMAEGGWNYLVPYQMRFSDPEVEKMVMSRKAYSQAGSPESVEKILSEPGNETFKEFVEWQNLPSYLQLEYLQSHPKIIPFMVSGFSAGDNQSAGRAIVWSKLRKFSGVADPTAYNERLGYRMQQLKGITDAVEAREIRDAEVKWWTKYRKQHVDDHDIYRLTEEWEKSEGAFGVGGHFYQQGRRGYAFYQNDINLKWAGIDDSFIGISSYDADSYRLARMMDEMGGASRALLQLSPNYEMYVLRKVQKSRDSVREIAKRFLDVRQPTRLSPSDISAAGYSGEEAKKLADAVNFIDRLWDEADKRIKPLGKYGYATKEGREIRKRAIIAQNRLLHSSPLLEKFLGEGAVSLFRSTYLTKPVWERSDFVDLEQMDPVERETFQRLLTRKVDGKRVLKGVPYLPEKGARTLPAGKIVGYQPVVRNGKVTGWKAQMRIGGLTGLVTLRKNPKGVETLAPTVEQAIRLMQFSFEKTPSEAADLLGWRSQVRAQMPRWAQDLAYDWVRSEAWKHYFLAASSARSKMRDTVNPWYSDAPGFSSQSKYGMKLKKWLQSYAKYLEKLSPEFGTEYRSYNDDNMLTNAILGWYL